MVVRLHTPELRKNIAVHVNGMKRLMEFVLMETLSIGQILHA